MTDTITLPRATVQQALEAWDDPMKDLKDLCVAMDAIRTALEQQQAEPVHGDIRALKYRIHELEGEVMGYKRMLDVAEAASQPQQQAEPVAFVNADNLQGLTLGHYGYAEIYTDESAGRVPLYTAPPQRKELSASEILNMMPSTIPAEYDGELMEFARAVEAKTKEGA